MTKFDDFLSSWGENYLTKVTQILIDDFCAYFEKGLFD